MNKNIFYNNNIANKEEIINRSNEFDINFSGKSILFDKEKTINLLNEIDDKDKNKKEVDDYPLEENSNLNKIKSEPLYNFNFDDESIKMFTLKEEEEEETIKSNCTLYNGDFDKINLEEEKSVTK